MAGTRHEYDRLSGLYLPIAVGVVVVIFLLVVVFALRYRARGEEREPSRVANAPRLELVYALVLTVVAAVLLVFTFTTEDREERVSSRPAVEIHVTAAKWHWRFDYPAYRISEVGHDVTASAGTPPGAIPTLRVPAGRPVRFVVDSLDVIHAFWIPELKFKHDANPGHTDRFELTFSRAGTMAAGGECSEFCGLNHAGMNFNVDVLPAAAFRAWAAAHRGSS